MNYINHAKCHAEKKQGPELESNEGRKGFAT